MMGKILSFIKNLGFRKCRYCGKYMWNATRIFENHCCSRCLFQDQYREKLKKGENLYKDISSIMTRFNYLCSELNEVMNKYKQEGR